MFLLYRNQGERHYGAKSIAPYPRRAWQFQLIKKGPCTIIIREGNAVRETRLVGPVLSVAGPECVHGFGGKVDDACQVMVFHFDEADFLLRSIVGEGGHRAVRLSPAELPAFQALYDRCSEISKAIGTSPPEMRKRAGFFAPRVYGVISMELTLLFLKRIPKAELGPVPEFAETKVAEALAYYEANLVRAPRIADVAQAIHVSSTHLRRLFHKIRGISPQQAFTRAQFERAKWLMRDPSTSLERVAESSGFASSSDFSRAFRKNFGVSPSSFRERQS